jgi:predicted TIM-barrel fold metal-dependent hydrolase
MVRRHAGDYTGTEAGHRRHLLGASAVDVRIFEEPKVDCHVHVLDPARFPYGANTHYRPMGQEMGTPAQLAQLMEAYGTQHALLVGPNSGYGLDNSCLLDTIARAPNRYRGIAVVENDISVDALTGLKSKGVVGVAWNVTHYGLDYYRNAQQLLEKLVALDMFVDIQTEHDQLQRMMPLLMRSEVQVLVDHCGRPTVDAGLQQPGFRALLELGATKRAFVKLSGFVKFSGEPPPYKDAWPFVEALVDSFTLDRCLWASDWPYLRAPARVDYGVVLNVMRQRFPGASDRRKLLWDTPRELFGFES